MTIDQRQLYATAAAPREDTSFLRRILRETAPQDWLVFAYLAALNVAVLQADPSASRGRSLELVFGMLLFMVTTLLCVRGGLIKDRFFAPLAYRVAIYGSVQFSYFLLKDILPIVNPNALDLELYALDVRLFGFEPAMRMDAIVNSFSTEWFAFFYFGYFFLLALHVIPLLLFGQRERILGEFCFGMLVIFCIGHVLYMVVPGYGPYRAMSDHFTRELPSGMWRDMVMATVASGGAQKDIFPSLHTAAPTFILLFSFRHRDKLPFRFSWPVVAFTTVNIIVATMFLRWHYVIDVVVGLLLAALAAALSVRVTRFELARRRELGLGPNWPLFFPNQAAAPALTSRTPERQRPLGLTAPERSSSSSR